MLRPPARGGSGLRPGAQRHDPGRVGVGETACCCCCDFKCSRAQGLAAAQIKDTEDTEAPCAHSGLGLLLPLDGAVCSSSFELF